MLFWLCLIVLIVGIGLVIVGKMEWFDTRNENKLRKFLYKNDCTIKSFGWVTVVISGIIMVIMIFVPNIYDQFETIDYTKYGKE